VGVAEDKIGLLDGAIVAAIVWCFRIHASLVLMKTPPLTSLPSPPLRETNVNPVVSLHRYPAHTDSFEAAYMVSTYKGIEFPLRRPSLFLNISG